MGRTYNKKGSKPIEKRTYNKAVEKVAKKIKEASKEPAKDKYLGVENPIKKKKEKF